MSKRKRNKEPNKERTKAREVLTQLLLRRSNRLSAYLSWIAISLAGYKVKKEIKKQKNKENWSNEKWKTKKAKKNEGDKSISVPKNETKQK